MTSFSSTRHLCFLCVRRKCCNWASLFECTSDLHLWHLVFILLFASDEKLKILILACVWKWFLHCHLECILHMNCNVLPQAFEKCVPSRIMSLKISLYNASQIRKIYRATHHKQQTSDHKSKIVNVVGGWHCSYIPMWQTKLLETHFFVQMC